MVGGIEGKGADLWRCPPRC